MVSIDENQGFEQNRLIALQKAEAILAEHFDGIYILCSAPEGNDSITYFRKNITRAQAIGLAREAEWLLLNAKT